MTQEVKTKTDPSYSAQFKQWRQPSLTGFGAPFSAISRAFRAQFETIQEQFETIGAMASRPRPA
jgi:hypothetical protein